MALVDIKELAVAIKNEKTSTIKLLHHLLFNNVGDRRNRDRIRQFAGFLFPADSEEFKNKIMMVKKRFHLK